MEKIFKNAKLVSEIWPNQEKFDHLNLCHPQAGVFGILTYGSYWRPQLLLKTCRNEKKSNEAFWRYFQKSQFLCYKWAEKGLNIMQNVEKKQWAIPEKSP